MTNQQKFNSFRSEYSEFIYRSYSLTKEDDGIHIQYNFEIPGLCEFHPTTRIATDNLNIINKWNSETAEKLVFSLGMVELVSYWKCACPPKVKVLCGGLDEDDKNWWKRLYLSGLGEFFYRNEITTDFDSFMQIEAPAPSERDDEKYNCADINLIPVGGGKDSDVTLELLSGFRDKNMMFTVNNQGARTDAVLAAGYTENNIVKTYRTISPELLERNKEGFFNGHTPFSAIVAFLSLYCSYLIGGKYIVLSNEASANEGNVEDAEVNHQYSKSFEFESDFYNYVAKNLVPEIHYFSILRAFNELQIAKKFAACNHYHPVFRSCNVGSKKNIWCCNCAKCLFVYGILSPFIERNELVKIFGEDLLDKESLKDIFDGLVGFSPVKPFECVGTQEEIRFALSLAAENYKREGIELPVLLKYYSEKVDTESIAADNYLLKEFENENHIPQEFITAVKEMYDYVAAVD